MAKVEITTAQRDEIVTVIRAQQARILLDNLLFVGLGVWYFTRKKKGKR